MKKPGDIVGNWEIICEEDGKAKDGHRLYSARCIKCGYVRNGMQLSQAYRAKKCHHPVRAKTFISRRLGNTYRGMIDRCYNENNKSYKFYGAKGITVCDCWLNNPEAFSSWALLSGYNDRLTIDRIDPKKPYQPDNCRWVTPQDNSKYKSTSRILTVNGITNTVSGWAKRLGIPKNTFVVRVRNLTDEEAVAYIEGVLPN